MKILSFLDLEEFLSHGVVMMDNDDRILETGEEEELPKNLKIEGGEKDEIEKEAVLFQRKKKIKEIDTSKMRRVDPKKDIDPLAPGIEEDPDLEEVSNEDKFNFDDSLDLDETSSILNDLEKLEEENKDKFDSNLEETSNILELEKGDEKIVGELNEPGSDEEIEIPEIEIDSEVEAGELKEARDLYEKGQREEAVKKFNSFVNPKNKKEKPESFCKACLLLASYCESTGKYNSMEEYLGYAKRTSQEIGGKIKSQIEQQEKLIRNRIEGKNEESISRLQNSKKLYKEKKFVEAAEELKIAAENINKMTVKHIKDPSKACEIHCRLGSHYRSKGKYKEMKKHFDLAEKLTKNMRKRSLEKFTEFIKNEKVLAQKMREKKRERVNKKVEATKPLKVKWMVGKFDGGTFGPAKASDYLRKSVEKDIPKGEYRLSLAKVVIKRSGREEKTGYRAYLRTSNRAHEIYLSKELASYLEQEGFENKKDVYRKFYKEMTGPTGQFKYQTLGENTEVTKLMEAKLKSESEGAIEKFKEVGEYKFLQVPPGTTSIARDPKDKTKISISTDLSGMKEGKKRTIYIGVPSHGLKGKYSIGFRLDREGKVQITGLREEGKDEQYHNISEKRRGEITKALKKVNKDKKDKPKTYEEFEKKIKEELTISMSVKNYRGEETFVKIAKGISLSGNTVDGIEKKNLLKQGEENQRDRDIEKSQATEIPKDELKPEKKSPLIKKVVEIKKLKKRAERTGGYSKEAKRDLKSHITSLKEGIEKIKESDLTSSKQRELREVAKLKKEIVKDYTDSKLELGEDVLKDVVIIGKKLKGLGVTIEKYKKKGPPSSALRVPNIKKAVTTGIRQES